MDKGYYKRKKQNEYRRILVAIHNKNGQGLLPNQDEALRAADAVSQSTIKMDKGYYLVV